MGEAMLVYMASGFFFSASATFRKLIRSDTPLGLSALDACSAAASVMTWT